MMSDAESTPMEGGTKKEGGKRKAVDISSFSEGQKLEGKVLSVKAFGAFVEVPGGANVLLPRSVISRGAYSKLTKMAESKSQEAVKLEIVTVDTVIIESQLSQVSCVLFYVFNPHLKYG